MQPPSFPDLKPIQIQLEQIQTDLLRTAQAMKQPLGKKTVEQGPVEQHLTAIKNLATALDNAPLYQYFVQPTAWHYPFDARFWVVEQFLALLAKHWGQQTAHYQVAEQATTAGMQGRLPEDAASQIDDWRSAMLENERHRWKTTIQTLLETRKETLEGNDFFTVTEEELLGMLLADYCEHVPARLFETAYAIFEDSNYRSFNREFKAWWTTLAETHPEAVSRPAVSKKPEKIPWQEAERSTLDALNEARRAITFRIGYQAAASKEELLGDHIAEFCHWDARIIDVVRAMFRHVSRQLTQALGRLLGDGRTAT
jgi:hypothetical protein